MRDYYSEIGYFEDGDGGYDDYPKQANSLSATFRYLLNQLSKRGITGGALLDVGCGFGYFLQEAVTFFDFRAGTEMSPVAAEQAQARADEIYVGGIETIPAKRKFDCVVALQVIEHVYHPRAFLNELLTHVNDNGTVVLAAPNMAGFWRILMGRRWPSFKYPEHVVFYDSKTLATLMRGAGLQSVESLPYPHAFPLGEICRKLALPVPGRFSSRNVWLPATTVAAAGRLRRGVSA